MTYYFVIRGIFKWLIIFVFIGMKEIIITIYSFPGAFCDYFWRDLANTLQYLCYEVNIFMYCRCIFGSGMLLLDWILKRNWILDWIPGRMLSKSFKCCFRLSSYRVIIWDRLAHLTAFPSDLFSEPVGLTELDNSVWLTRLACLM